MWYSRSFFPSGPRISTVGCRFSSDESTMISRMRPVTSSTSSCTVSPSMMSLKRTAPFCSVNLEKVKGSHSTSTCPCSTCWPSVTRRCAPYTTW